jgi:putative Ca2+/H+ antiporter (TMEM165/GDT1 family)
MYLIFFIYSFVEGQLVGFQLLAIINKVTVNIVEHVSLLCFGASYGYILSSVIAVSSDKTISNFLRSQQIDFQSGCTSL